MTKTKTGSNDLSTSVPGLHSKMAPIKIVSIIMKATFLDESNGHESISNNWVWLLKG